MDCKFLNHLAQEDILNTIFLTLQDENFQVREQAVELLGKLKHLNPAFIFLKFRRVLLESISQLVNSRAPNLEEQGARMVANLSRQV
jgi:FKBP12-rapamycin complex-associated protein